MISLVLRSLRKIKYKFNLYNYRKYILGLISNGLKIGKNVTIMRKAWIDPNYPYLISIGNNCSISKGVRLIAHDATAYKFLGATRIGKIDIKDNCFIGENAIILPGTTIGPNVIVAAGSMVNKDIPPNSCVAGNPARVYAKFDEFIETTKKRIEERPNFKNWELKLGKNEKLVSQVIEAADKDDVYVTEFLGKFPWTWNQD